MGYDISATIMGVFMPLGLYRVYGYMLLYYVVSEPVGNQQVDLADLTVVSSTVIKTTIDILSLTMLTMT